MLRPALIGLLCLCAPVLGADARQQVLDGTAKLRDTGSYAWRAVGAEGDGGQTVQDGKTDRAGYTLLTLNAGDAYVQIVLRNGQAAVNAGEGWKTADEISDQRRASRYLVSMARTYRSPAIVAGEVASRLGELKRQDDGYVAEVDGEGVMPIVNATSGLLGGRGGGGEMTNAKAEVQFWLKDGVLSKYEVHVTGTVNRRGMETEVDRTMTVEFTDVGRTKVDVPDEVKQKLGS